MSFERSEELWSLLFGSSVVESDILRWTNQKFGCLSDTGFVLNQSQGGPCGVLAPIQAFLIHALIHQHLASSLDALKTISASQCETPLVAVIASIIQRALPIPNFPVIYLALESIESKQFSVKERFDVSSMTVLDALASVVASRTIDQVMADMDDSSTSLIERFGHCSQETLNLMLIGRAVSNVFDRDQPMGDTGMVLHGVPDDSDVFVGLMSELEYLRYVCVGQKLKNPRYPFWVLGSASHYTVLFSFDSSTCYVPTIERVKDRIVSQFSAFQFDQGLMDESRLNELAAALDLPPPELSTRTALCQSGLVILDDVMQWASPQLLARPEFAEPPQDVTKEFDQLYLVNNQTPTDVYSVQIFPSGTSSCSDPTLLAIIHTRWPGKAIVVSHI